MQRGFSSVIILIISFLMILLFGTGIWYFLEFSNTQTRGTHIEVPTSNTPESPQAQQQSDIPEGWIKYTTAAGDMTFAHPPEAEVNEGVEGVTVHIIGPTQSEGTELFDGLAITLSTLPLNTATLDEVTRSQHAESEVDPVTEKITAVEKITYAGREGYRYEITNLGTQEVVFLPLTDDLYLKAINSTVDPSEQGYQQIAEQIVATVRGE